MNIDEGDYEQHISTLIKELNKVVENDPDNITDEHKAFDFLCAKIFSETNINEQMIITDGKDDQGIDLYTRTSNYFEIFQCKIPDIETLESNIKPHTFDDNSVKDIQNAFSYLTGDEVQSTVKKEIKNLRSAILLSKKNDIEIQEDFKLDFYLCIFGELSKDAKSKFDILKSTYDSELYSFHLKDYKDILSQIIQRTRPRKKATHSLTINKEKILSEDNNCYLIAHAKDFYSIFDQYGWSIFDLNVRSELKNSPINRKICDSLKHDKTMKNFQHLNNGILIFCESFKIKDKKSIDLINPQIINGCQTVRSIHKTYLEICNDLKKKELFDNKCFVQVKVLSKSQTTDDLIDTIIVSTNNQNPMSQRNLKSNTSEQIKIKSLFEQLDSKWFYQRKDGEFDSLKDIHDIGSFHFRISDFRHNNNRSNYRYIDNEDMAKSWLCFIGCSYLAMMNKDFFKDDNQYNYIFNSYPNNTLWENVFDIDQEFKVDSSFFNNGKRPSAEEYLLSNIIFNFIDNYALTPTNNKKMALLRLKKSEENMFLNNNWALCT